MKVILTAKPKGCYLDPNIQVYQVGCVMCNGLQVEKILVWANKMKCLRCGAEYEVEYP